MQLRITTDDVLQLVAARQPRRVAQCMRIWYPFIMAFNYSDYFERRAELCGGALVVKGTRVPIRTLLASLAEGAAEAEILADFPTVSAEALRAVIAFAAASAGDDLPVPPVPAIAA